MPPTFGHVLQVDMEIRLDCVTPLVLEIALEDLCAPSIVSALHNNLAHQDNIITRPVSPVALLVLWDRSRC